MSTDDPGPDHQPALTQSILDEQTLAALFDDIEALGHILGVTVKGAGQARAGNEGVSLREAYDLLRERAVAGVQIRYLHDGQEWWDTLMHSPQGVR
ncbi:MAG: hypothetical protein H0U74_01900, partial [Bradymonadaceae bacterium]|nr:hypothetical protein [Lujinxingiaceae bacterium]